MDGSVREERAPEKRLKVKADPAFLAEARSLHDEIMVVNGLDASLLNEEVVRTLKAGGVDMNMSTLPDLSLDRYDASTAIRRVISEAQM